MPATFVATAACVVQTLLGNYSATTFGSFSLEASGFLNNGTTSVKPTRTVKAEADHSGFEGRLRAHINPQFTVSLDGKQIAATGTLVQRHPGELLLPSDLPLPSTALHQFSLTDAYWSIDSTGTDLVPGAQRATKFEFFLMFNTSQDVCVL